MSCLGSELCYTNKLALSSALVLFYRIQCLESVAEFKFTIHIVFVIQGKTVTVNLLTI